MTQRAMSADGSITLPPSPWGTSATWADYDWDALAAVYVVESPLLYRLCLLIADAVRAQPPVSGSAPVQGPGAEPVRDETQR